MKKSFCNKLPILLILIFSLTLINNPVYSQFQEENNHIDVTKPVGVIPGEAGVSSSGTATYQIPIFCSPGTNGMQPSLSISYNSQSGYGTLGWGWDLYGTSSITRTPKTIIQDGVLKSVEMGSGDVFSLEGNRLYVSAHGMNMTVYSSEYANFCSIVSSGTSGHGPLTFTVTTNDGLVKQYGYTANSRAVISNADNQTIGIWRLNKVTDINGNYMIYNYNAVSGLLSSISYTGDSIANITPYNQIIFTYTARSDSNISYPGYSAKIADKWLLTEIQVKNEDSIVKKYQFVYDSETSLNVYSLLSEIIESDRPGSQLNSTKIVWNDKISDSSSNIQVEENPKRLFANPGCPSTVRWIDRVYHGFGYYEKVDRGVLMKPSDICTIYGDFNGDSYMDIMELEQNDSINPTGIEWSVFLFNSNIQNFPEPSTPDASGTISDVNTDFTLKQMTVADIDGDKIDEIFLAIDDSIFYHFGEYDSIDFVCYKFENSNLTELPEYRIDNLAARGVFGSSHDDIGYFIDFMDLDGDGKENEMMLEEVNNGTRYIYNHVPPSHPNIDNLEDLVDAYADFTLSADLSLFKTNDDKLNFVDFNGNGKVDLLFYNEDSIQFYEYTGSSYSLLYTYQNPPSTTFHPGDYNGDGKTDLLFANDDETYNLLLSTGNSLVERNNNLIPQLNDYPNQGYSGSITCQDYNGDGKTDVLYVYRDNEANYFHFDIFYSYGAGFKKINYDSINLPHSNLTSLGSFYPAGDINGDGNDDLYYNYGVFQDGCSPVYTHNIFMNTQKKPLLVKSIINGFLQNTSFTYKPISDTGLYTIGNNSNNNTWSLIGRSYLVSSMKQPDGIGGTSVMNYIYEGGLVHKYGKGLLGFSKVISEDTITKTKSESYYLYDSIYLQMNLVEAKMYLNNSLVSDMKNSYKTINLSGTTGHGFYKGIFCYNDTVKTTDYLTGTTVTKLYHYGSSSNINANKGNPISVTESYGNDGSVVTSNTYTNNTYTVYNGHSTMSICRPSETIVTSTFGSEPAFTKNTTYQYNTNGLLWKVTDFSNLSGSITTTYNYTGNNFGNVTQKTISTSGLPNRYTTYTYDTKGRFITGETNMLNQTISYQYNTKFGVKKSVTGINNLTTTYTYDRFGNLTAEHLPNGETNTYSRGWALNSGIPNVIFYTNSQLSNAPDVKTYYDAMGRVLYVETDGFAGAKVYNRKEYNAKGQVKKESQPYYSGDTPKWTTYAYDNNDRLDSVNNNGLISTYAYSGKTVTVTDPSGKSSSKTVNNMGQVVSATDNGGTITYTYCSNGQPKTINAPGSIIENRYDDYGRQTKMIDPDAGTTSYVYNNFGELYSQTDTNGNTYTMTYDNAGRLTQKTGSEGSYIYTYVPNGDPGAGLVQNIKSPGDSVGYIYNDYGLPTCITDTISGTPYTYNYSYDDLNNNTIIEYPNLFRVKRHYDDNGQLDKVKRDDNSYPIWELNSENALGQATQIKQSNGVTTNYTYNQYNLLTQITSPVQNESYVWNANTGNLTSRSYNTESHTESFTYDNLDRLTAITRDANVQNVGYQANGNISSKYDAGSYTYDPVKIHSISKITDDNCYSAIDQALQNITYTPFKKVKTIQQQNDSLIYTYGHDMERRKMQLYENGQLVKNRIYCGMYEKDTMADNTVKEYCYISGGSGVTAVLINDELYFLRRDVQGTITGLIDMNDVLVEEYSYDAWGRRRNPTNWTYDSVPQPQYMHRGYTMHEMLDEFGLINMNGRCYDPVVGRFLSPDIVVQNPNSTQCYNRYSYAVNNPLKYTDPSGWSWTPIDALHWANRMQNTMMMDLRKRFQPSIMRSGSSSRGSGFDLGSNGIVFQTTIATIEMELAAINNMLKSVFGMPGLFGNPPEDDSPNEYCSPSDPGSTVLLENISDFMGCKGLFLCDLSILPPLEGNKGMIGIHISMVYDAGSQGASNNLYHFNQLVTNDGATDEDGVYNSLYGEISMTSDNNFKRGKYNLGTQYITFEDTPNYFFATDEDNGYDWDLTPSNHEMSGKLSLTGKNHETLFEFVWSYQITRFGDGPYDWEVKYLY